MIIGLFCCDIWSLLTLGLGRTSERLGNSLVHAARRAKSFKMRRRRRLPGLRVPIPQREGARSGLSRALSLPPPPPHPPANLSHTHFLSLSRFLSLSLALSLSPPSLTHSFTHLQVPGSLGSPARRAPLEKRKKRKKGAKWSSEPLAHSSFRCHDGCRGVHLYIYVSFFNFIFIYFYFLF